jgi:hypothetical protein
MPTTGRATPHHTIEAVAQELDQQGELSGEDLDVILQRTLKRTRRRGANTSSGRLATGG